MDIGAGTGRQEKIPSRVSIPDRLPLLRASRCPTDRVNHTGSIVAGDLRWWYGEKFVAVCPYLSRWTAFVSRKPSRATGVPPVTISRLRHAGWQRAVRRNFSTAVIQRDVYQSRSSRPGGLIDSEAARPTATPGRDPCQPRGGTAISVIAGAAEKSRWQ